MDLEKFMGEKTDKIESIKQLRHVVLCMGAILMLCVGAGLLARVLLA
jgi:hypothetical protein